jgi:hypothetical protein
MFMPCIGAMALVLILEGAASATILYSPPLLPEADGRLVCQVVNVSAQTLDITLEMYNSNGTLLSSFACFGPVGPGKTCATNSTDNAATYCKVIVNGSKKAVRGSLMARNADNVTTAAVVIQ